MRESDKIAKTQLKLLKTNFWQRARSLIVIGFIYVGLWVIFRFISHIYSLEEIKFWFGVNALLAVVAIKIVVPPFIKDN